MIKTESRVLSFSMSVYTVSSASNSTGVILELTRSDAHVISVNAHPIRQRAIIENDSTLVVRQSA